MTRPQGEDAVVKGRPVNYCAGFRPLRGSVGPATGARVKGGGGGVGTGGENPSGIFRESFALNVDSASVGIAATPTPRIDRSVRESVLGSCSWWSILG